MLIKIASDQLYRAFELLRVFVAILSVSNPNSPDYHPEHLQAAADFTTEILQELNFKVRQVSIEGSAPFVLAEKTIDLAKKTLIIYAHYDVQPVERDKWKTDPFVLTERDGRLYGRGASDDKGGIIAAVTALSAYEKAYGVLPVNIRILCEGEEEYGSEHMRELIKQEKGFFQADALIVLDGGNRDLQTGSLCNATRGLVNLQLEVKAMDKPTHSGIGCLVPDPSLVLARLMTSLSDPRQIPGFMDDCQPLSEQEKTILKNSSQIATSYAKDHLLIEGAHLRGDPHSSISERVLGEPSISFVNGRWGKPNGGNSIQETASCQVGIRITAGQDPDKIAKLVADYLLSQPGTNGLKISVTQTEPGSFAWKGDVSRPLSQLYLNALQENFQHISVDPTGGAIPFLYDLQQACPGMEIIMPGVEDPACAAHSHNESQHIGLFERATNSLIGFLEKLRA